MEKTIKKSASDAGFEFEVIAESTNRFGYVVKHVKSLIDNKEYELIEALGNYYIKEFGEDWQFGIGYSEKLLVSDFGKFVNYKIEKSGSSSIMNSISIRSEQMIPTISNRAEYRQFVLNQVHSSTNNIGSISDLDETVKDYTHFFVYRDPVKRFLSMANFCNNTASVGLPINQKFETKREIIENYLLLCSLTESNSSISSGETHFLSQSKHLLSAPRIDLLVEIKNLSEFLKSRFGDRIDSRTTHRNKTRQGNPLYLTVDDLTESDISLIKEIFADDYKLLDKYADKIWKPITIEYMI